MTPAEREVLSHYLIASPALPDRKSAGSTLLAMSSPVVKRRGGEVYDERFTGCVYVVRAEGTNAVKVGFSKDVI